MLRHLLVEQKETEVYVAPMREQWRGAILSISGIVNQKLGFNCDSASE